MIECAGRFFVVLKNAEKRTAPIMAQIAIVPTPLPRQARQSVSSDPGWLSAPDPRRPLAPR